MSDIERQLARALLDFHEATQNGRTYAALDRRLSIAREVLNKDPARYRMKIELSFTGPRPEHPDVATHEVEDAKLAAEDAARTSLIERGYHVQQTSYGVVRLG